MTKFKDIKTRTQLMIGFGFVFILIVALSVVAWQQTDRMGSTSLFGSYVILAKNIV